MKLTALRLHNVKRFGGHGIAIEGIRDGVNVLTAANEYGKSTAFEALHALFFQPHTSASKSVQVLRPYSGGNPRVEAEIETEAGRFRLTKQFYGGKRATVVDLATGRLVAQADEAEAFISDLTRGGSAGPAGLLWVRQGATGMEKRSNSEEESDKKVRETLLSSVQGEVEALTGGRRMADILAACEADISKLVTATLRPKTGGRYAQAIEDRDRLLAEEARLRGEVETLREALDKRRRARTRLAELERPEDRASRRDAIAEAEAAHEKARSHSEALRSAEAEASLARHRHEAAAAALLAFDTGLSRAAELDGKLAAAGLRRDEALARRATVTADDDSARLAIAGAEAAERDQRDLLARLDRALRAREAAGQSAQLRARLEKADAARHAVEGEQAALAAIALSPAAVADLQKHELDILRLRAAQEATLPTLRIDYADGASPAIDATGSTIENGREVGFAHVLRLDLAGIGTLTLRSNRPATADKSLEQALSRRDTLLQSLGVTDLTAAQRRLADAQDRKAVLDLAHQRLSDLAPDGIEALQAEIARLDSTGAADEAIAADPEAARKTLAEIEGRVAATRNHAREIQPLLGEAANAVVAAETALAALAAERAGLDAALGPAADRAARRATLQADVASLVTARATAEASAHALRHLANDLTAAEATLRRVRSVETAIEQEVRQLGVTLADLNGNINARADGAVEEIWHETEEALAAARAAVARFETEVAVLDRLRTGLTAARAAARDLYLKPVVSELRPLLGLLFDDISIVFDEDTLLPQTVTRNGLDEDVERLSGGMREQLSILTRLAFARLLARDGRAAPVILDDALVYSDDERIVRMFDALHRQARDQQILVFSCRQRAFESLGGNVLQMQPWHPAD